MGKIGRNAPCPCGSGKKFKNCHGKGGRFPDPDNVAAIYLDEKKKNIMFVTKDMLINQLLRDGPKIAKSFDKIAMNDLKEVSEIYSDAAAILLPHYIGQDFEDQSLFPTCARLLDNVLATFTASVEVARHGYRRQYGTLARVAVETLCTILHLMLKPESLDEFHGGKFKSSKAINTANKVLPIFGGLYGLLSNQFVHITSAHASFEPLIEYKEGEEPLGFILPNIRLTAWLIYVVTELVFFPHVSNPRYWRSALPEVFAFDPSEEERSWMQNFFGGDEFREVFDEPTSGN